MELENNPQSLADLAWLNFLAYENWSAINDPCTSFTDIVANHLKITERAKERLISNYSVVSTKHFKSGLDAVIFRRTHIEEFIIALDGTDPSLQRSGELMRDIGDVIALLLGRGSRQVEDYLSYISDLDEHIKKAQLIGIGHSLGGYVQQIGAALAEETINQAVSFNAPNPWRFSREYKRLGQREFPQITNVMPRDLATLIGKPVGRPLPIRSLRAHSILKIALHFEMGLTSGAS